MFQIGGALRRSLPAILVASIVCILGGIGAYAHGVPNYWNKDLLIDASSWGAGCAAVAWVIRRSAPASARTALLCLIALYLVVGAGLQTSAAAVLLLGATFLYGRTALRLIFRGEESPIGATESLFVGIAIVLAVFGALIHFAVNYPAVYLGLLLAPFAVILLSGRTGVACRALAKATARLREALSEIPYWYFTAGIIILGWVGRFALFPSVGYDDNAQHLRMWAELAYHHVYTFNVITQVWAAEPFAVDLLHAIISLVAGADARSAMNLAVVVLLLGQLWSLLDHFSLRRRDRFLLLVLFASTPMLAYLLTSLQTELFLALLVTGGVNIVLRLGDEWNSRTALAVLAVAAECAATKLPGFLLGALLIAAAAVQLRRAPGRIQYGWLAGWRLAAPVFVSLLAFVALNSYITAWKVTGNPAFPLYNGIFKSPYFAPHNFFDPRYAKGVKLTTYWNLFFHTSAYFESRNFVAGFQYLFLLPIGVLLTISGRRRRKAWSLLIPLLGFGVTMFWVLQYWRYVFPVLPLGVVAIASLVMPSSAERPRGVPAARLTIIACILLNLYFLPGVSWIFKMPAQRAYTRHGRWGVLKEDAPAAALTKLLNDRESGETVLYPRGTPYGATLHGRPVYVNWYSPSHAARMSKIHSEHEMARFLKKSDVDYVVWNMMGAELQPLQRHLLRNYLTRFGYPEYQIGSDILYRLLDRPITYHRVFHLAHSVRTGGTTRRRHHSIHPGRASGRPGIVANQTPHVIATVPISRASAARYTAEFRCRGSKGYFIAQVNWNVGSPYYRLVRCSSDPVHFSESIPVPAGATKGLIYVTVRDTPDAYVSNLKLAVN